MGLIRRRRDDAFRDRREAGRALAEALDTYRGRPDLLVLGLPRGGVPVAWEVAAALPGRLDVFVVRKLGVPRWRELAMGAIATGGGIVVNDDLVRNLGVSDADLQAVIDAETAELARREAVYRGGRPPIEVTGRTVILVDDGVATGASMFAATRAVRLAGPAHVVIAVPVAPPSTCAQLTEIADDVVCVMTPPAFMAVGEYYRNFDQTTDDEVRELLLDG